MAWQIGKEAVWLVIVVLPCVFGDLDIYPSAHGAPKSNKFQVFVSQNGHRHESFVYMSTSDHRYTDSHRDYLKGRSMSWTSFAFSGSKVTVEVQAPHDFQHCIIRPKRYGFSCHRTARKVAQFDVTSNTTMMSVEFDYDYGTDGHDITDKLMVFADPPETHTPNKNDHSVLYYDVGVHDLQGQLQLDSHIKEVYIAPGAFIKGGFKTTADHPVKIYGRGIVDNREFGHKDPRFSWATVNMDKGGHHHVEGITISDSCWFALRGLSDHNTVYNVKMVAAWVNNNDGATTGHDGVIQDSFIHANDDAIKLYASNLNIQRIVVWMGYNGAVFQTGWWGGRDIQHVKVSDVDIIHTDWCAFQREGHCSLTGNKAVFDQAGGTSTFHIADVELKNINVEGSCPRIIYWKMQNNAHGTVTNIRFINWNVDSQPTNDNLHNEISGSNNNGHLTHWHFQNFKIGGHCVSNPSHADFIINGHSTDDISFECGGGLIG